MLSKNSFLAFSFFASTSLFATCPPLHLVPDSPATSTGSTCNTFPGSACAVPDWNIDIKDVNGCITKRTINKASNISCNMYNFNFCYTINRFHYINVPSCPPNLVPDDEHVCNPIPLEDYDGDPDACHEHGGWVYGVEKECVTEEDFKDRIKNKELGFAAGTGLKIAGALMTAAGLIGLPFSMGASAGLIAAGIHAYGGGAAMVWDNNTDRYTDSAGSVGQSLTSGGKTLKINIADYTPSNPALTKGQTITVNDDVNKRVTEGYYVPQTVIDQMANSDSVDLHNNIRTPPIDLTGVQKNTYDYTNNIVTTQTQVSPTHIRTETAPFTVTQNPDQTITATPSHTSPAPTVSGSNSGSFTNESQWMQDITAGYNEWQEEWDRIAAGGTPNPNINTSPVPPPVNSIDKGNADIISKLDEIKTVLNSSEGGNHEFDDGTDGFGDLDAEIKGSYEGFIYTDPLGLNAIGGAGGVPTFGFTLYGRHYIVFDQAMLDNLPLELIRNLFLFIAAISAFLTVISGV